MPLPEPNIVAPSENTMRDGVVRSGYMNIFRLKRRYRDINFEQCAAELCYFLKNHGNQTDFYDFFRVAERAIYPRFGSVGLNRDNNLKTALYYWRAVNDDSADMISTATDRRNCFVRALYECQRGNNALDAEDHSRNSGRINFVDNRSTTDATICLWGVNNKFAEVLLGMHPDIELIDDLQGRIIFLIKAFLAEYLYSHGKTYNDLKDPNFDMPGSVPQVARNAIKNKIIGMLGKLSDPLPGYLSYTELNYIEQCLGSAFEYISFSGTITSRAIAEMIVDANRQLREAQEFRAQHQNSGVISAQINIEEPNFAFEVIAAIITDILPRPSNMSQTHGLDGFEFWNFTGNTLTTRGGEAYTPNFREIFNNAFIFGELMVSQYTNFTEQQRNYAMQSHTAIISQQQAHAIRLARMESLGG